MEFAHHHDIELEPLDCDGNDANARDCAVDGLRDRACVQIVHSCIHSLDDIFDDGCSWTAGSLRAWGPHTHSCQILKGSRTFSGMHIFEMFDFRTFEFT